MCHHGEWERMEEAAPLEPLPEKYMNLLVTVDLEIFVGQNFRRSKFSAFNFSCR